MLAELLLPVCLPIGPEPAECPSLLAGPALQSANSNCMQDPSCRTCRFERVAICYLALGWDARELRWFRECYCTPSVVGTRRVSLLAQAAGYCLLGLFLGLLRLKNLVLR